MRRLEVANRYGGTTCHAEEIDLLRKNALRMPDKVAQLGALAAAELLACHDQTGISLDNWTPVREFVEAYLETPLLESGV